MPKKATVEKKLPAMELKHPKFDVAVKLPLKIRPENINWKKYMPKSNTQILVALLVIAAFLLGVLFDKVQYLEKNQNQAANQQAGAQNPQGAAPQKVQKVNLSLGNLPALGDKNAKVTLVEFADFRCPYCEKFFSGTEPQILQNYVNTNKIQFVFRNFAFLPGDTTDGQQASVVAANAAECANDQGKFWDYYNYLYKNQPSESDTSMYNADTLTQEAVTLGMNGDTFKNCLTNKSDQAKVSQDLADGQKAGVQGTPSFFINGEIIVGACPYATIAGAIDAESAHKQWSVDSSCQLVVK